MDDKKFEFNFTPRVVTDLLGSQLVENIGIAIAEQIKNSLDANATDVTIEFKENKIIISDNGMGMSESDIEKFWFKIGTDNKNDDVKKVGGKGIGRLSLFSIGNLITVSTIHDGVKVEFSIRKETVEDGIFAFPYAVFKADEDDGTVITIEKLVDDHIDYKEIQIELENLFLNRNINVRFNFPKSDDYSSFLYENDVKSRALIDVNANLKWDNEGNLNLEYSSKMNGVDETSLMTMNFSKEIEKKIKSTALNYDMRRVGDISFKALYFYMGTIFLKVVNKYSDISNKELKDKYLSYNSGINIYRNNVKIFNFGKNDWLNLTHRRLNSSSSIDNELISGRIILQPVSEKYLVEKTNREGFIFINNNRKYINGLKSIMKLVIEQVTEDRKKYAKNDNIEKLDAYLASKNKEKEEKDTSGDKKNGTDIGKEDNNLGKSATNGSNEGDGKKIGDSNSVTNKKKKDDDLNPLVSKPSTDKVEPTQPKASKKAINEWKIIPGYSGTEYVFKNIGGAGKILDELGRLKIAKNTFLSQIALRPILETSVNELYKRDLVENNKKRSFDNKIKEVFVKLDDQKFLTELCSEKYGMKKIEFNTMKQYLKSMNIREKAGYTNITTHRVGEVQMALDKLIGYLQEVYVFSVMTDRWIEVSRREK